MKSVLDDVRYALRLMRRRPGFTLAAVSTLALGIGANSAIFSIIHVLSFKPLPYRDPGRVVFVQGWDIAKGESRFSLPQSDMLDLQRHTRALEAISAYRYLSANLTGGDTPERVQAYRVTSNTFDLLGVAPELGRTFGPSDIGEGRLGLAVISHGLWQRVFGGSASVIGRSIIINGDTHRSPLKLKTGNSKRRGITPTTSLVLACANVANLLLARGVSRYREFAVRAAIGASRARIYRQISIESLVLALAGGASAVLLGTVTLRALHASLPEAMLATVPNVNDIGMDLTTVAYTSVVAVLVSVAAGLLPAWRVSRASSGASVHSGLKDSASAGGGRTTRRLRTGLVIAEVALATWLLVGAGLLVRSYRLQHVDPGFAPAQVATMTMTLPDGRYPDPARRKQFYARVLERVEKQPGVTAAGFVNVLPSSTYDRGTQITIDGHPPMEPGREPEVSYRVSSPRYHAALGIPLLAGRFFCRYGH